MSEEKEERHDTKKWQYVSHRVTVSSDLTRIQKKTMDATSSNSGFVTEATIFSGIVTKVWDFQIQGETHTVAVRHSTLDGFRYVLVRFAPTERKTRANPLSYNRLTERK